jgi:GAF domain-containing protein
VNATLYEHVTRAELVFLTSVADACADSYGADEIATSIARSCVPALGDAVFVDLCERGEFDRRAGVVCSPEHPALAAALQAHATSTAWHTFVERVVMTGTVTLDPTRVLALSAGANAAGFLVVPLVSRGKILGVLGAVSVESAYSRLDLELARKVARRAARAIDDAR